MFHMKHGAFVVSGNLLAGLTLEFVHRVSRDGELLLVHQSMNWIEELRASRSACPVGLMTPR